MATDWDVACRDCNESLGLDLNRGHDECLTLIACAPALAALHDATVSAGLHPNSDSLSVRTQYDRHVPLAFWSKHAGHVLRPKNEYGEFDGDCNKRIQCACGAWSKCRLLDGHDGECSKEKP